MRVGRSLRKPFVKSPRLRRVFGGNVIAGLAILLSVEYAVAEPMPPLLTPAEPIAATPEGSVMSLQWLDMGDGTEVGILRETFVIRAGLWDEECSHLWTITPSYNGTPDASDDIGSYCFPRVGSKSIL